MANPTTSSNRNLYLAALIACLSGALFGYSVGFIGGILVLPSFLHHFGLDKLSPERLAGATAVAVSTWLLGALLGVLLAMPVCSKWGRRWCLWLCAGLYVLGATLQLLGNAGIGVFDMGRMVNGLGVGAGTLVSPMYISEIATPPTRGMLLSGYQTALQLAALAGFWAAFAAHSLFADTSALQWKLPVAAQLIPGCFLLLGGFLIPESPTFLWNKGRTEEATAALVWLRGGFSDEVSQELNELEEAAELAALKAGTSLLVAAREPSVRRRLAVGVGLMIAQNMVGLNALNYYAPTIFPSAGFTSVSSCLLLTGLFGLVKLASALSFMFLFVNWFGNRFWLKLGSTICGISIFILAICIREMGLHKQPENTVSVTGVIAVAMVYIFAFGFGMSLGPLSWNICSEMFPAHIKTECCAVTTVTQWLFQIVIAASTPLLLAKIGWVTYVLYSVCCAVSFIWIDRCVPETKNIPSGRAMEEVFGVVGGEISPLLSSTREQNRSYSSLNCK